VHVKFSEKTFRVVFVFVKKLLDMCGLYISQIGILKISVASAAFILWKNPQETLFLFPHRKSTNQSGWCFFIY